MMIPRLGTMLLTDSVCMGVAESTTAADWPQVLRVIICHLTRPHGWLVDWLLCYWTGGMGVCVRLW
jgi:hypothetical protein